MNNKIIYDRQVKMYKISVGGLEVYASTLDDLILNCMHAQKIYNLI